MGATREVGLRATYGEAGETNLVNAVKAHFHWSNGDIIHNVLLWLTSGRIAGSWNLLNLVIVEVGFASQAGGDGSIIVCIELDRGIQRHVGNICADIMTSGDERGETTTARRIRKVTLIPSGGSTNGQAGDSALLRHTGCAFMLRRHTAKKGSSSCSATTCVTGTIPASSCHHG